MRTPSKTLAETDITSRRAVSRRALLHTLGLGAGLAVVGVLGTRAVAQQPKRRDPCRDSDHGPSDTDGCGRPPTS
jgi:hypothetical protein